MISFFNVATGVNHCLAELIDCLPSLLTYNIYREEGELREEDVVHEARASGATAMWACVAAPSKFAADATTLTSPSTSNFLRSTNSLFFFHQSSFEYFRGRPSFKGHFPCSRNNFFVTPECLSALYSAS